MTPAKFLLDTNVFIPVEDSRRTPEIYATLLHDLQALGHGTFVHDATIADIARDTDVIRRNISLSKLSKYQKIRTSWRDRNQLAREFGEIRNENDYCDCQLLAALSDKAVDFLVTQDGGLHTRARRHGLSGRVLYVRQALDLLNEQYARPDYTLSAISNKLCYELNRSDKIFDSLRGDYIGFDSWFDRCCAEHRECWVVQDDSSIAALIIKKDETAGEVPKGVIGEKILKLCTFKVSEEYRGGRLGEQLLRQAMCFAFDAGYDSVYLTAFEKQISLRELIMFYGFRHVSTLSNGELVYSKNWRRDTNIDSSSIVRVRRSYPQFPDQFNSAVIVPVKPVYHDRLFPEASNRLADMPGNLFSIAWSQGNAERSGPSNSIRKAYVCSAQLREISPRFLGSVLSVARRPDGDTERCDSCGHS